MTNHLRAAVALAVLSSSVTLAAHADVEPPVLHAVVRRGVVTAHPSTGIGDPAVPKTVDGDPAEWTGTDRRYSGVGAYSEGEYVYDDYLFDAFGADDGDDGERVARNDALEEASPGFYRLEPMHQYDVPGELGLPSEQLGIGGERTYGDAMDTDGRGHVAAADLRQVRLDADEDGVYLLVETTTFTESRAPGVVVLVDTVPGSPAYDVPFNSGLTTATADVAVLLAPAGGVAVQLATGERTGVPVAAGHAGWTNVLEARLPRDLVEHRSKDNPGNGKAKGHLDGGLRLALAAGVSDGAGGLVDLRSDRADVVNVANVAFRPAEPVRIRFDKRQAFALSRRTIDDFTVDLTLADLLGSRTDQLEFGGGYYERQFRSSEQISVEGDTEGVWQPYGLYRPAGAPQSVTFWMHWRGGDTHDAATVSPRIFRDFGEEVDGVVVAPRGRGTSTWYVGRGHVDFREVYDDAMGSFGRGPARERVYVTGHSMGGWASYLLPILYPDRFAAALPYAGVPTQGLWAGCEFEQCWQGTNGGNAKAQWTTPLLDNLRHVPVAISHGALDELVPVTGVTRQADRLRQLGYQYRYYLFPAYEHYSHPVHDEWEEGAAYARQFSIQRRPQRLTYIRSMPFERTVETGPNQGQPYPGLNFDFDSAYWMSGLTPVDPVNGVARVDAAYGGDALSEPFLLPEAAGPVSVGQHGPWVMQGQRWSTALPKLLQSVEPFTGLTARLTGASAVQFDLTRMYTNMPAKPAAKVTADAPLTLRLRGDWTTLPPVTVNGAAAPATFTDGVLAVSLPAGTSTVVVG